MPRGVSTLLAESIPSMQLSAFTPWHSMTAIEPNSLINSFEGAVMNECSLTVSLKPFLSPSALPLLQGDPHRYRGIGLSRSSEAGRKVRPTCVRNEAVHMVHCNLLGWISRLTDSMAPWKAPGQMLALGVCTAFGESSLATARLSGATSLCLRVLQCARHSQGDRADSGVGASAG